VICAYVYIVIASIAIPASLSERGYVTTDHSGGNPGRCPLRAGGVAGQEASNSAALERADPKRRQAPIVPNAMRRDAARPERSHGDFVCTTVASVFDISELCKAYGHKYSWNHLGAIADRLVNDASGQGSVPE